MDCADRARPVSMQPACQLLANALPAGPAGRRSHERTAVCDNGRPWDAAAAAPDFPFQSPGCTAFSTGASGLPDRQHCVARLPWQCVDGGASGSVYQRPVSGCCWAVTAWHRPCLSGIHMFNSGMAVGGQRLNYLMILVTTGALLTLSGCSARDPQAPHPESAIQPVATIQE